MNNIGLEIIKIDEKLWKHFKGEVGDMDGINDINSYIWK